MDETHLITRSGKPLCITKFKVNKEKARKMIPRAYWASLPPTQDPTSLDALPPETSTQVKDFSETSGWVSSNNEPTKNSNSCEHSAHIDGGEQDALPGSGNHEADSFMGQQAPSHGIKSDTLPDRPDTLNLPTGDGNDKRELWDDRKPKTVSPKEESQINNQAASVPDGNGSVATTGRKDTWIDEDHDGMNEADDADEELLLLRQELGMLEARKATRFWRAADEPRFQSITQRIIEVEAIKTELASKSNEDESRARAAAQNLMGPLTVDGFLSLAKGSDTQPESRRAANSSKRKVTGSSDPYIGWGPGPGPVQKKQRVAKTAVKPRKSHAKTGSIASLPNLLKFNGNGEEKISKKTLKDLPSISKAPAHLRPHLHQVQACAMKRTGVDKDTIAAHVRWLVSMTKILSQKLHPWVSEINGDEKTLDDYRWSINGMNHPLYHHQMIAAAMMTRMERNTEESHSRSGLLFDHMGYGKTIEALSLIKTNPPDAGTATENGGRLTVVVCPTSVGLQWVGEINKHCDGLRATLWCETLEAVKGIFGYDVLVVSYERLRAIYKKGHKEPKSKSALFRAKLHRLILDEIHEIKSPKANSVTFKACMALDAEHYWGLTGTPTPNGIEELYPYLLFIRHPDITAMDIFKAKFVGGKGRRALSMQTRNSNLAEVLESYALLRTPKHHLLGEALVNLPESHQVYKYVQLSKEERIIYKKIESDMKDHITMKTPQMLITHNSSSPSQATFSVNQEESQDDNSFSYGQVPPSRGSKRANKTKNNKKNGENLTWANLCESALRFRQCVASPLMLENLVKEKIWTREQVQAMKEEALSQGCSETPFIDMIRRWIDEPSDAFSQELVDLQRRTLELRCPGCKDSARPEKEPQQASCEHIWCKQCLVAYRDVKKREAPDQEPACPDCNTILGEKMKPPSRKTNKSSKRDKNMPRQPGDDSNKYQPKPSKIHADSSPNSTLFKHLDNNPTASIPLSAKMAGIVDQVLAWQKEAASEKIIIFTQFIDVNRLIARTLQKENIEFLYLTGGMGERRRKEAIEAFADKPEVKVMLISLKCGGQALNLTQSNRVIIADPWWNLCAEQQAFARVHRIGQKKETYAVRFLAEDTIDTRMYDLQQQKLKETQGAIQEFQADKSLGPRTLRMILGEAWYDEEANDDEVDDYQDKGVDDSEEMPTDDENNAQDGDYKG